jgi:PleD family two-component response regulator
MDRTLPVLVVDDARFSRTIITRSLADAGFEDVRFAASATEALGALAERSADLVIADWRMPGMDGLALARRIREMDEFLDHYTCILLLSGEEQADVLGFALREGVDDFVSKTVLRTDLLPRVLAACRTTRYNNELLARNRSLREELAALERRNLIDPHTGLGNRRFAERTLTDILRQTASRGGAAGAVLVGVVNYAELVATLEPEEARDAIRTVATRLEGLVRPMDVVTRLAPDVFAVLVHQPSVEHCTAHCFRRLLGALDGQALGREDRRQALTVALSACAAHGPDGIPGTDEFLAWARARLREAVRRGIPTEGIWRSP